MNLKGYKRASVARCAPRTSLKPLSTIASATTMPSTLLEWVTTGLQNIYDSFLSDGDDEQEKAKAFDKAFDSFVSKNSTTVAFRSVRQ
ncbi:hypothetical protein EVG20_g8871 [Dentipellis fragilis]|uniref:Uncharacterized protein n=1 Tax=Dentipellis fragilis TaxID=205917 RepID=A0A4Y9Y4S4_9AGAM|nr:hypothetical protein EVG20_g8871 [Dentipellis fragilis]